MYYKPNIMNKMNRRIFNFFLLVMFFGIASSVSATTYRLQRVTSVESGQKYVFEQAGYVMSNSLTGSGSSTSLQTTNSFNTVGLIGAESYVWTLESASSGFKMKNDNKTDNKYLANLNSTNLSFVASKDAPTWTFSFQPDGTAFISSGSGTSVRTLGYASPSLEDYNYKCYTSGYLGYQPHSVVVYKLVEEAEGKSSPQLNFVNKFEKLVKGTGFTPHVLSTADGFTGSVSYASSNNHVATVNATTGEVTIVGSGHALITASSEADETYDAGEATYTIVVMDGDGTSSKPFSVTDFYSGFLGSSNASVWATGYIVGYYSTSFVFKTTADDDKCVAIADSRDGVTSSNITLIQFKTGDPQTNYGLKSHPEELGKLVKAYGKIGQLRNKTCIDNVESLSFADYYPVSISKYKYATYRTTEKLDFTGTGVSAYTAAIDGSSVKLTKISDGIVDTGLGVVLYSGTAGTYDIPVTTAAATVTNTGLLISDGTKATKDNKTYVLGKKKEIVGFYRWIGNESLPAGRVYLNGGASAARDYLEFAFDDEATGMRDAVHHDKVEIRTDVVYDLQGRRVAQPGKGLYIVNGKKIVIK